MGAGQPARGLAVWQSTEMGTESDERADRRAAARGLGGWRSTEMGTESDVWVLWRGMEKGRRKVIGWGLPAAAVEGG